MEFPPPYIPRRLTFEIPERINAEGGVEKPLDEAAARAIIEGLPRKRVDAVAVALLWSIVNPNHELRIGEMIAEIMPGVPYTLSHQLNPIIREFPRTSSTAIDASLKPLMQSHLAEFESDLRAAGCKGEVPISTSSGGVMHVDDVAAKPIYTVKSGPAMGPLAGIAERMDAFEQELRSRGIDHFEREHFVEARYINQQWEMKIPMPMGTASRGRRTWSGWWRPSTTRTSAATR